MNYKGAVLFDLDGTLVDTAADFVPILNGMRHADGMQALPADIIRNTVSDGARALITLAYDIDESHNKFEQKRQTLLDLYEQELGKAAGLFSGFSSLLQILKDNNIAWGVVTNKPQRFTDPLLTKLNLKPSNKVAICPDHVKQSKPHPEPLLLAAKQLNLSVDQCVYAGDHDRDIQAGKNAGMHTIACAYGYIKPEDNINDWQADTIVNTVDELQKQLQQYFNLPN